MLIVTYTHQCDACGAQFEQKACYGVGTPIANPDRKVAFGMDLCFTCQDELSVVVKKWISELKRHG